MKRAQASYGYYRVAITSRDGRLLLRSNSERAFIMTVLQDALSPRLLIAAVPAYRQLASCIDLLAFSIRGEAICLLFFAIDTTVTHSFAELVQHRLAAYQSEWSTYVTPGKRYDYACSIKRLRGPHHALKSTIQLHLLHEDWEYDRYSSIGFYLHDRRGDWMRTWRMARLYDNMSDAYRTLIYAQMAIENGAELPTPHLLVS